MNISKRFQFGKNWKKLIPHLNEERIQTAEKSITDYLGLSSLKGYRFLDLGCGSGLFSLAARRLGAEVYSFDYDENSVECAKILKNRFYADDALWTIERGDALDKNYMSHLGAFDIVYSWGVLHHTGNMYEAFRNSEKLVKSKGFLYISIYNDQGLESKVWKKIKRIYVNSSGLVKLIILLFALLRLWGLTFIRELFAFGNPLKSWKSYAINRGMSPFIDVIDWVGGYPFEVAKPEEIFVYFLNKGFQLKKLKTCCGGRGCNEFVFQKNVCEIA